MFTKPAYWLHLTLRLATVFSVMAACSGMGSLIVYTELDVQVAGRDAQGRAWRAMPGEIVKQTRHPRSTSPFANTVYDGALFEWRFLADPKSIGYSIRSKVPGALCFRFDQARLTSNLQPNEIPMRVNSMRYDSPSKPFVPVKNPPGERPMFTPPLLCFAQGELTGIGFVVDMAELFPSGNMFNIRWEERNTNLIDRGIGNWLKIRVPIEYEGKREELEITLTATNSAAWLAYI
jgi:hypothetical protein